MALKPMLRALAYPFIIIFGSAFILRVTGRNNQMAIFNNWGFFAGLTLGYFINGQLLKRGLDIRKIFTTGIFLPSVNYTLVAFVIRAFQQDDTNNLTDWNGGTTVVNTIVI